MASSEQLEAIAARLFPRLAPGVALARNDLFLARVMSAGNWDETRTVLAHFGRAALQAVLAAAPARIFDRESWNYWHGFFGLTPTEMPEDFFTTDAWFKNRSNGKRDVTAEIIDHLPNYGSTPVFSCDEPGSA